MKEGRKGELQLSPGGGGGGGVAHLKIWGNREGVEQSLLYLCWTVGVAKIWLGSLPAVLVAWKLASDWRSKDGPW